MTIAILSIKAFFGDIDTSFNVTREIVVDTSFRYHACFALFDHVKD